MQFDIGYLVKSKVILDHFPVHSREEEREKIKIAWDKYGMRLARGFMVTGWEENMQPLNVIKDYYGPKFAFYFAWLVHYTGMLLWPVIMGIIIFVYQVIAVSLKETKEGEEKPSWADAFNTPVNAIYAIFVLLWTTGFVESWKRKENKIADMWLMRDFEDPTQEREDFKAAYYIDQETKSTDKISRFDTYGRMVFQGIPISVFFIGLVVGV